jgi:hypothetical protein
VIETKHTPPSSGRPFRIVGRGPEPGDVHKQPTAECAEPAVVASSEYERWVTCLAEAAGCRERDIAYVVAYRSALRDAAKAGAA